MANSINTQNISKINSGWPLYGYDPARRQPGREGVPPIWPVDRVTLSKEALREQTGQPQDAPGLTGEAELNEEQKQQVKELKKRDAEVKSHEQAHMASGGALVQGGASFEFQNGPDGRMYAVGGEVKIDMSAERTPEATIRKMQQVRRAALAPSEPSGTDRAVAAQASQIETQARVELSQKNRESDLAGDDTAASPSAAHDTTAEAAPKGAGTSGRAAGGRIDLVI